jgi:quinohemoprotein ethanol dehydrogenase
VATAGGLVFQGALDGTFKAYRAEDGRLLWSFAAGAPVLAPPIVFSVDGREYVSVITGTGVTFGTYSSITAKPADYRTQAHRVLTFALGGKAHLPTAMPDMLQPVEDDKFRADPVSSNRGALVYATYCYVCHGSNAVAAGTAPDLRTSGALLDKTTFRSVVYGGALKANGMPQFEELGEKELADLRQYLRQEASKWRLTSNKPPRVGR